MYDFLHCIWKLKFQIWIIGKVFTSLSSLFLLLPFPYVQSCFRLFLCWRAGLSIPLSSEICLSVYQTKHKGTVYPFSTSPVIITSMYKLTYEYSISTPCQKCCSSSHWGECVLASMFSSSIRSAAVYRLFCSTTCTGCGNCCSACSPACPCVPARANGSELWPLPWPMTILVPTSTCMSLGATHASLTLSATLQWHEAHCNSNASCWWLASSVDAVAVAPTTALLAVGAPALCAARRVAPNVDGCTMRSLAQTVFPRTAERLSRTTPDGDSRSSLALLGRGGRSRDSPCDANVEHVTCLYTWAEENSIRAIRIIS